MTADPDGSAILTQLLLLLFFTFINAFFAGAEMAVVSVNKTKIKTLAEEGNKKAIIIENLFHDSTKFLSTIQVAITFAGFYSSASAASGISPYLGEWLTAQGIPYGYAIAYNGVTILLMFFNLVFGELVPKRIALQKAEWFCMVTVMPIHYISIILSPFIKLLSISTKLVLKILGLKTEDEDEKVTEEEIKALMKVGLEEGTFDDDEKEMVDSVFEFGETTAREIMVPRNKAYIIDFDDEINTIIDEVLETRHTRIPVYQDTVDNIIGILNIKDVMIALRKSDISKAQLKAMIKPAYFVPESQDADDLFKEMQKERIHMAIVVDEYGGFSGILTIEDLVEEIMGDINEEYETVEPDVISLNSDIFVVKGTMNIYDFNEYFNSSIESIDNDTVGGYFIEQIGYIPDNSCKETITCGELEISVKEADGHVIHKLLVKEIQKED